MGISATTKPAKGKGGRARKAAVETQPSPMGQRVVPRVDAALKAKVEAANARKKKQQVNANLNVNSFLPVLRILLCFTISMGA